MVDTDPALLGAFKTPGLRGVAQRAPYMHAGQFATLEQVVRHYVTAPHAAAGHSELTHRHPVGAPLAGHDERAPIELTEPEVADLVSFLETLGDAPGIGKHPDVSMSRSTIARGPYHRAGRLFNSTMRSRVTSM